MAGFTRVNGSAQPGAWYGLNPRYLSIETGNVTIDTNYDVTLSNFEKAVFAVSSEASIVVLGTPSANIFVVVVDDSYGAAKGTSGGSSNLALSIKTAINANVVTITESTGFVGGAINTFA